MHQFGPTRKDGDPSPTPALQTVQDIVSELVIPYIFHFGQKGYAPQLVGVETENVITVVKVEGPRLGEVLKDAAYAARLPQIYRKLGTAVGYFGKCGVAHCDLHAFDVVVADNDTPVVIDWENAMRGLLTSRDDNVDAPILFASTAEILGDSSELLPVLRNTFDEGFESGQLETAPQFMDLYAEVLVRFGDF